jgi:hypothetical protein
MIMSESIRKDFPDWETYTKVNGRDKAMYNENFDFDLES